MDSEEVKPNKRPRSAINEMATRELLDSRRLFYFFNVARCGSFTAAERVLDVAQPTLTRTIQQLESDIGSQLLQRTGRGVMLTMQGQILYRHAESIFNNMAVAIEEIDVSRRKPAGRLTIATPPAFSATYMPEVIRRVLAKMPDIELSVLEASTGQVHDFLASGEVDLAVVLHPPTSQKVVLRKILTEELFLIVHHTHPFASAPSISRAQLAELELIIPANLHGSRQLMSRYFLEGGEDIASALQIDSLPITKAIIAQGSRFGSLLARRSCAEQLATGQFAAVALRPSLKRSLHLARTRDRPETPYSKEMGEQMAIVLAEMTGIESASGAADDEE